MKINDLLFENFSPKISDRFVSISNTLSDNIIAVNAEARVAILPPVCKFNEISQIETISMPRPYFLYCASLAYEDVAWFVIESFLQLDRRDVDLTLVLNGVLSDRIRRAVEENTNVSVLSNLNYHHLIGLYKGAHALLIPLRDIQQDIARYPQKVSEYLASGRPIVSCNVGEIGRQFTTGINSFLSEKYDTEMFSNVMKISLENTSLTEMVAKNGYTLGAQIFDSKAQEQNLRALLIN